MSCREWILGETVSFLVLRADVSNTMSILITVDHIHWGTSLRHPSPPSSCQVRPPVLYDRISKLHGEHYSRPYIPHV
jgi:hypothetical protein